MKKIMISQPMNGVTKEQIIESRNQFLKFVEKENLEVVNSYFIGEEYSTDNIIQKGIIHIPVYFLAKSINSMSLCHKIYFAKGWENARGCKIEHNIATKYRLEIIYE